MSQLVLFVHFSKEAILVPLSVAGFSLYSNHSAQISLPNALMSHLVFVVCSTAATGKPHWAADKNNHSNKSGGKKRKKKGKEDKKKTLSQYRKCKVSEQPSRSPMRVWLSWRLVIPSAPRGSWKIRRGGLRGPRLFLNTQQQANAITDTASQWPNQISREGTSVEVGACRKPGKAHPDAGITYIHTQWWDSHKRPLHKIWSALWRWRKGQINCSVICSHWQSGSMANPQQH